MPDETDASTRAAAVDFAEKLAAFAKQRHGSELLGFYLIGSLAHGGFNRRYSDIDLALIGTDAISQAWPDGVKEYAGGLAPDLSAKLSLFWADEAFSRGRFPPLDRKDYIDHGIALIESRRANPPTPALEEVRTYLGGGPFERWEKSIADFAEMDGLDDASRKPYLRAHLYPARFVNSWNTGSMASNDEAVTFLAENCPDGLDRELIGRAFQCRLEASDPDHLFAERGKLDGQVAACRRLMQ